MNTHSNEHPIVGRNTKFHKCASGDNVILHALIEWLRFCKSPAVGRTSQTYTL